VTINCYGECRRGVAKRAGMTTWNTVPWFNASARARDDLVCRLSRTDPLLVCCVGVRVRRWSRPHGPIQEPGLHDKRGV
jgi:hypothetical protein